jgi:hypothetical protein
MRERGADRSAVVLSNGMRRRADTPTRRLQRKPSSVIPGSRMLYGLAGMRIVGDDLRRQDRERLSRGWGLRGSRGLAAVRQWN